MRPVMRVVTEEATRVVSEAAVELVKGPAAPDRAVGAPMSSVPSVSQVPVVSALPPSGVAAQGAIARPRVLFVDDSLSVRKVAERTLVELGVDVTLAVDGVDALEKLRDGTFDLIFTDLEMPRMHGYELIREVRFMPRLKEIPMVVVSSRSGTRHQDQARSVGASDYLTKPFTTQMLKTAIEHLVPRWKAS
jgi:chemosensory pili system protein ChpA (sensor histidine kinase/response regulator)